MNMWAAALILLIWTPSISNASDDKLLAWTHSKLPKGWSIEVKPTDLIIALNQPVKFSIANCINAPVVPKCPPPGALEKWGRIKFSYRTEPLWSAEKMRGALKENQKLERKVARLGRKHCPARWENFNSKRGPASRLCTEEMIQLESKRRQIPAFHTDTLSLLGPVVEGWGDVLRHEVGNESVSREADEIIYLLSELGHRQRGTSGR